MDRYNSLWLFNPDHDLVLGINEPHYIAPMSIRKMKEDLDLLPIWYAPNGDAVYASRIELSASFLRASHLKPKACLAAADFFIYNKVYPWGWNRTLRKWLLGQGFSTGVLPTLSQLDSIRELSGRGWSVDLSKVLYPSWGKGESELFNRVLAVKEFVEQNGKTILKAPWSGSGKGLRFASGCWDSALEGWVVRTLATQGSVVGEPLYKKVKDFAMEFYSSGGAVSFVGYSLFETDSKGSYQKSVLGSNDYLEQQLLYYISQKELGDLRMQLELLLTNQVGDLYEGYLGVDMMVCLNEDDSFWIHPCVEINLRINMGVVARLFYDQYVCQNSVGYYVVAYEKKEGALLENDRKRNMEFPLQLLGNQIQSGYCSLTPIFSDTHYQAYVVITEKMDDLCSATLK
ncbi:MAG: hypothetical protein ACRCZY_01415 [Phocaeicola sp.]